MWPFKHKNKDGAVIEALNKLLAEIEKKNISVVLDDWDAGYDLAIDEVLALISSRINEIVSETEVDYSGGY